MESLRPMGLVTHNPGLTDGVRFPFLFSAFFIGVIAGIKIDVLGIFFLGEILGVAYLFARLQGARLTTQERWFAILAALWSGAQLLSDIINQTEFLSSIKGVLAPLLFASTTIALIIYFRESIARMPSFLIGATMASLINLVTLPGEYFLLDNQWKWGFGAITLSLFLIYYSFFCKQQSKQILFLGLIAFLIISLLNNARSFGLLSSFAGIAFFFFTSRRISLSSGIIFSKLSMVKATIFGLLLVLAINFALTVMFSYDPLLKFLPEDVAQKARLQASNEYGLLFGARPEIMVSLQAFLDSPLFGHGSWAVDRGQYLSKYFYMRYTYGVDEFFNLFYDYSGDLIPAHSFLMGSLVWAGFLGGAFWIYVLTDLYTYLRPQPAMYRKRSPAISARGRSGGRLA